MALEVSMTGTGTIGNIAPGWSLNESATPVTIGEKGAGTGALSFAAQATDDSLLVINNDITSTIGDLGTIDGIVQSVSQTGLSAQITHGTYLDKFNLDVTVPAVESGGVRAWFYKLGQSTFIDQQRPDYSIPITSGYSGSTQQYSYCFPFDNNGLDLTGEYGIDSIFRNSIKSTDGSFGYSFTNSAIPAWESFSSTVPMMPGIQVEPNWYQPNPMLPDLWYGFEPYFDLMLDVDADTDVRLWLKSGAEDGSPGYFNTVYLKIDGDAETVAVVNVNDETTTTGDYSSLVNGDPLLFTFSSQLSSPAYFGPAYNRFYYKVTNSAGSTITGYVDCFLSGILNFAGDYINCNKMYYFNAAYVISYTGIYNVPEVENYGFNIDFTGYTGTYNGAYPATSGVAWELIQDIAAAENFEVCTSGNTVIVRDIGSRSIDISNRTTPTTNPTSTLSGRQINISYSDAAFVSGNIYNAELDGNNIISVEAGATTVTSVKWEVNPLSIEQPVRSDTWPIEDGQYYVIDSAGLPLLAEEWEGYGAYVSAIIDPEDNSAIQITVKGPSTDVTLAGGPYELAASDSGVKYASLKLSGTGVYAVDNQLQLTTAIDTEKYTRATVNSISNPFIVNQEQAYDRGVWASMKASGPVVTVNFSLPASAIDGVGLTPGALFDYNQSTYRVVSSTIGNLNVSITAERHVLVADTDAIWGSQTVADFDAVWGALECQDQIIFPYKVA